MIDRDTVDKIIEASKIEEVVGEFVKLKRRGVNMIGNCPFHNEKTPSFTVSPAKGIYKCFGCSKAGNSVNFIMEHEKLSYPEALRFLANKYGIHIEEIAPSPEYAEKLSLKESLYILTSFSQKYFTQTLFDTDEGKSVGMSYFRNRGFTDATIQKFQLGYCLEKGNIFSADAIKNGFSEENIVKLGLSSKREYGLADVYRGRVIFPIHNLAGKVIAFGARILTNDKTKPKYINSPESEVYVKSNIVYGISFAKNAIVQKDNCYLVEGYTDVISLHQSGIENVVASSGTSLTTEQIKLIRRFTKNITILYDGDAAGIKASFRGIDMILEEGMNVKVLLFPDGEDPDSYARSHSPEDLTNFVNEKSVDFIKFKTSLLLEEAEKDPIKKANLIKEIVNSIALIPESITRAVYIRECSLILEIGEQVLFNELNKIRLTKLKSTSENINNIDVGNYLPPLDVEKDNDLDKFSSEYQEKEIIRLLLLYGNKDISFILKNEDNEDYEYVIKVAEYIVNDLTNDQISLSNQNYQKIFEEYVNAIKNHLVPDESIFHNHLDALIQNTSITLTTSPYQLNRWEEAKHIVVLKEESIIKKLAVDSVYSLKLKKIELMIHENNENLRNATSEEDIILLQQERIRLLGLRKIFAKEKGIIIIK